MNRQLQELIARAEERFLADGDLKVLESYVASIPDRLETYRILRDRELTMVQAVADELSPSLPGVAEADLKKALQGLLLVLRYCAMGILTDDEGLLKQQLLGWLEQVSGPEAKKVNEVVYKLFNQQVRQHLNETQMNLLQPFLTTAQVTLIY
ncbi:MAG: hypothetical protein HC918_12435 [Oscillatoriales cyanobacterium SM2_1_8]|nr:hypothetical protein [Oscillatoriales cyanobacterium SM2_1_8]